MSAGDSKDLDNETGEAAEAAPEAGEVLSGKAQSMVLGWLALAAVGVIVMLMMVLMKIGEPGGGELPLPGEEGTPGVAAVITSTSPIELSPTVPPPTDTPEPTPTATRVVSKEDLNEDIMRRLIDSSADWRDLEKTGDASLYFMDVHELQARLQQGMEVRGLGELNLPNTSLVAPLGFAQNADSYVESLRDAQIQNMLGFYDIGEKQLYMLVEGDTLVGVDENMMSGKIDYILLDQNFDMAALLLNPSLNADQRLARCSLVEGDAALLMSVYGFVKIEQLEKELDTSAFGPNGILAASLDEDEADNMRGISAPLTDLVLFPYIEGQNFTYYLYSLPEEDSWVEVDNAYANPPASTEQILHPEKYRAGEAPKTVLLPDLGGVLGGDWQKVSQDVLGEAVIRAWLSGIVSSESASRAADGWGGDVFALFENAAGEHVFASEIVWDTEGDAAEFYDAYNTFASQSPNVLLERSGGATLVVIAPDPGLADRVRGAFGDLTYVPPSPTPLPTDTPTPGETSPVETPPPAEAPTEEAK